MGIEGSEIQETEQPKLCHAESGQGGTARFSAEGHSGVLAFPERACAQKTGPDRQSHHKE